MTDNRCVNCGKSAQQVCLHLEHDGTETRTWYCSKACQVADWPDHKSVCQESKQRRRLQQAADLLRSLLIVYQQKTFRFNLAKVEKGSDGTLHLYQSDPELLPTKRGYNSSSFPHLEEQDHKAILTAFANEAMLAQFVWIIDLVFKGFNVKHQCFCTKRAQSRIVLHHLMKAGKGLTNAQYYDGHLMEPGHNALVVRLKDGLDYVVDPAGARYGQHSAMVEKHDYVEFIVQPVYEPQPLGFVERVQNTASDVKFGTIIKKRLGEDRFLGFDRMSPVEYKQKKASLLADFVAQIQDCLNDKGGFVLGNGNEWKIYQYSRCVEMGRKFTVLGNDVFRTLCREMCELSMSELERRQQEDPTQVSAIHLAIKRAQESGNQNDDNFAPAGFEMMEGESRNQKEKWVASVREAGGEPDNWPFSGIAKHLD